MTERYLFRGKRLEENSKGNFPWHVGHLFVDEDMVYPYVIRRPHDGREFAVDLATIGQCTGLRDKNGKLIFEGDIVKFEATSMAVAYNGEEYGEGSVCWDGYGWAVAFGDGESNYLWEVDLYLESVEIIGNIHDHDNPELLEAGSRDGLSCSGCTGLGFRVKGGEA